jgi:hypothetical protein
VGPPEIIRSDRRVSKAAVEAEEAVVEAAATVETAATTTAAREFAAAVPAAEEGRTKFRPPEPSRRRRC